MSFQMPIVSSHTASLVPRPRGPYLLKAQKLAVRPRGGAVRFWEGRRRFRTISLMCRHGGSRSRYCVEVLNPARHHFLFAFIAPANSLGGVGVGGIVGAVIVVCCDNKPDVFLHVKRRFEPVYELPVEIVVWHH